MLVLSLAACSGVQVSSAFDSKLRLAPIETKQRTNDPYFAHYPAVEYEIGRLTIGLMDPGTGVQLWHGTGESELRVSAALIGLQARELTPLDNPQEWKVEQKVQAIVDRLRRDTDGRLSRDA